MSERYVKDFDIQKYYEMSGDQLLKKYLCPKLTGSIQTKNTILIGSRGTGKTTFGASVSEDIINHYGAENCTLKVYDNDNRFNPKYKFRDENPESVREEIVHLVNHCPTKILIFLLTDVRQLLSQAMFQEKYEKISIEKFIEKFMTFRHPPDPSQTNVRLIHMIVGTQLMRWITPAIRDQFQLRVIFPIGKSAYELIQKFCGLTREQMKFIKAISAAFAIDNAVGDVLLDWDAAVDKFYSFVPPTGNILDYTVEKDVTLDVDLEEADTGIGLKERDYDFVKNVVECGGRVKEVKTRMGWIGGGATQMFENTLLSLAKNVFPHVKKSEKNF
jgi:hypothetical protein